MRRLLAETTCDRCGAVEQREQAVPFTPPAWRILQIGYHASNGFVSDLTRLLCGDCLVQVHALLDLEDV